MSQQNEQNEQTELKYNLIIESIPLDDIIKYGLN